MTFTPYGKHLIAEERIGTNATSPSEPANRTCEADGEAFWTYPSTTHEARTVSLAAITDKIEAGAEVITEICNLACPTPACRASVAAPSASCASSPATSATAPI